VVEETPWAKNLTRTKERTKSHPRKSVEHPIGVVKRVLGFVKVRYHGSEGGQHLVVIPALVDLFIVRRHPALSASVRCPELVQQGS
jgi:hypothetical protein